MAQLKLFGSAAQMLLAVFVVRFGGLIGLNNFSSSSAPSIRFLLAL